MAEKSLVQITLDHILASIPHTPEIKTALEEFLAKLARWAANTAEIGPLDHLLGPFGEDAGRVLAQLFAAAFFDAGDVRSPGPDKSMDPDKVKQELEAAAPNAATRDFVKADTTEDLKDILEAEEPEMLAAGITGTAVTAALKNLAKILGVPSDIVDYITMELALASTRSLEAAAIAAAFAKLPGESKSTTKIGNLVHKEIQKRYIATHPTTDVVSEMGLEQTVWGPTTLGAPVPLSQLARSPRDVDFFFFVLRTACVGAKKKSNSWLRPDLVDRMVPLIPSRSWDIKPTRGAASGVWQETLTRVRFNVLRKLQNMTLSVPASLMEPGGHVYPPLAPVNLGGAMIAMPFCFSLVPGIIFYAVFDFTKYTALVAALATAMQKDAKLKKLWEKLGKRLPKPDAIEQALIVLVLVLLLLVVARALGPALIPVIIGVTPVLLLLVWPKVSEPTVDVQIGTTTIRGLPKRLLGPFMEKLQQVIDAGGKSAESMRSAPQERTS